VTGVASIRLAIQNARVSAKRIREMAVYPKRHPADIDTMNTAMVTTADSLDELANATEAMLDLFIDATLKT
jgi:hypothetical protein